VQVVVVVAVVVGGQHRVEQAARVGLAHEREHQIAGRAAGVHRAPGRAEAAGALAQAPAWVHVLDLGERQVGAAPAEQVEREADVVLARWFLADDLPPA
jgi:hypothetical protein